ncbi:MAG: hypothetical protein AAFQ45_02655 [Pseudomonadota bacterium]
MTALNDLIALLSENRLVLEVIAFGAAMFIAGWLTARAIGKRQVRAREQVLRQREVSWRRRHTDLAMRAQSARQGEARQKRRARQQVRAVMRAQ